MKTSNALITLLSLDEALKTQVGLLLSEVLVNSIDGLNTREILIHGEKVGRIYAYLEILQILQIDVDSI